MAQEPSPCVLLSCDDGVALRVLSNRLVARAFFSGGSHQHNSLRALRWSLYSSNFLASYCLLQEYVMGVDNTNCKGFRKVFRSWTHSKSMVGVHLTRSTSLFSRGPQWGTTLIAHVDVAMDYRNVRGSSQFYLDFGLNICGTTFLHGRSYWFR